MSHEGQQEITYYFTKKKNHRSKKPRASHPGLEKGSNGLFASYVEVKFERIEGALSNLRDAYF